MSVIETLTFRLAAGADEASFLSADARMQTEVYYGQQGLLRRTIARAADGEWLVLTLWASGADADAGSERVRADRLTAAYLAHIVATSMTARRFESLD